MSAINIVNVTLLDWLLVVWERWFRLELPLFPLFLALIFAFHKYYKKKFFFPILIL